MTPESPWFFFDREFIPRERRIGFGLVPWLFFGTLMTWVPTWHDIWIWGTVRNAAWGPTLQIFIITFLITFFALLGLTGLCLAGILLWAPRFKTRALVPICSLPGMLTWTCLLWLIWEFDDKFFFPILGLFFVFGAAAYVLTMRHIRRLDRAWFRFDG